MHVKKMAKEAYLKDLHAGGISHDSMYIEPAYSVAEHAIFRSCTMLL